MVKIIDSRTLLEELGYDYEVHVEKKSVPKVSQIRFSDIIPEFRKGYGRAKDLSECNLYMHQEEAYKALCEGKNVILISGTGSGKTEAWALYVLKKKVKTLTLYPTLALSADQIGRLENYFDVLGQKDKVLEIDRATLNSIMTRLGEKALRRMIRESILVITNPAFLMQELKRIATKGAKTYLAEHLKHIKLIVVDELDFYGSKGASLIIGMLELIINYVSKNKPQIVVLTATLGNPEKLAQYLTGINGRETVIIKGKPFKVENRVFLILGKNLEKIREYILGFRHVIEERNPELLEFIEDYSVFRRYVFKVIEALKAIGLYVPLPTPDISEILAKYVEEETGGVTLVFTRSIKTAEKLAKTLKNKLPIIKQDLVKTHHHLISKSERKEIEKLAREGLIRVIVSPRTLTQGIDIGTVVRIVHYGLPIDVREFKQREGRKGRRAYIPFTETLVIPISTWDRKLVEAGIQAFHEWLNLPLENIFFNPDNDYVVMFKGLFKIRSHIPLTSKETKLLRRLKLIEAEKTLFGEHYVLSNEGLRVWNNLGFYEYGPPYGIKRVLVEPTGEQRLLEEVSRRDFIEKLQPGCIDPTSDSIVVDVKGNRVIIEKDITLAIEESEPIRDAYEEYYYIKSAKWDEKPDLKSDYIAGKLYSQVELNVITPSKGFGKLVEIPGNIYWVVEARNPRIVRFRGEYKLIYDVEKIALETKTHGRYVDYTYGYLYELDPEEDTEALRVGLAYLMVALRLSKYRLPLGSILYYVSPIEHPVKTMALWEPEPAGIIKSINWGYVREYVEKHEPSSLVEVLMWAMDYMAVQTMILRDMDWEEVKHYAKKALDYIEERVKVRVKGFGEIKIPKPSKEHKILSLDIAKASMGEKEVYALALFDGETTHSYAFTVTGKAPEKPHELALIADMLSEYLKEKFRLIHYGREREIEKLKNMSTLIRLVIDKFSEETNIINVLEEFKKKTGLEYAPLEEAEKELGITVSRRVDFRKVEEEYSKALSRRFSRRFEETLGEYVKANAETTYILYLISQQIR